MKDLKTYIKSANHSNENWLIKNHPDIHSDILNYCSNINDLSFKQKLWHYQKQIPYKITCKNINCDNFVTFKGRWTQGYSTYCCQKCSISDVEYKKSLLNYSRKAKLSKEEKDIISKQKEIDRNTREEKQLNNKIKRDQESNRLKNISINEYLDLVENNNANGVYTREKYLNKNMPHILELLNSKIKIDSSIDEKVYMIKHNILERPKCQCGNIVKFINKIKGYAIYCSNKCSGKYGKEKASETLFKNTGSRHHSGLKHNIDKWNNKRIEQVKKYIGNEHLFLSYDDIEKKYTIKCDKCDKIHEINRLTLEIRMNNNLDWRNCITLATGISNGEIEVKEYIQSIYKGEIISNSRQILHKNEIDIYIPELKLGIEYNGVYFHSSIFRDKDYHQNKWKLAHDNNIKLVQIYEDEWLYKKDIVKSKLNSFINNNNLKHVNINDCKIEEIDYNTCYEFLNKNHLYDISNVNTFKNYGIFYNNELIYVMVFAINNDNSSDIIAMCPKLYSYIEDAESKILDYFISINNVNSIKYETSLEWPICDFILNNMSYVSSEDYNIWYNKGKFKCVIDKNYINDKQYSIIYGTKINKFILNI